MKLTNDQHEKIKGAVISAIWCARYRWHLDPEKEVSLKEYMKEAYLSDNEFFARVNCTVQRIIETIEAPSAVPVDRQPLPQNGGHHLLAAGGAEVKK